MTPPLEDAIGVLVRVAGDGAPSEPSDVSLDEPTSDAAPEAATVGRSVLLDNPSGVPPEATAVGIVDVVAVARTVGLNVPPDPPPDAPREAATVGGSVPLDPPSVVSPETAAVGNVEAVSAPGLVGGDVPPDTSEDADGVGTVVPAESSDDRGVGAKDSPDALVVNSVGTVVPSDSSDDRGVGAEVSPDTSVVAGVGAGEESPSSGQVTVSVGKAYIVRGSLQRNEMRASLHRITRTCSETLKTYLSNAGILNAFLEAATDRLFNVIGIVTCLQSYGYRGGHLHARGARRT